MEKGRKKKNYMEKAAAKKGLKKKKEKKVKKSKSWNGHLHKRVESATIACDGYLCE